MRGPQARCALGAAIALATVLSSIPARAQQPVPSPAAGRALFLGHSSGDGPQPLAFLRGSPAGVPAIRFACANCHGRDGLGQGEGSLRAPAIRWQDLARAAPQRGHAYDAARFARAIAEGMDPTGRTLDRLMPGYALSEAQLASLIAYLKVVDAEQRIGVEAGEIRLGILAAGDDDGFPAALAAAFARVSPIFGRTVELVPLGGEGPVEQRLREAGIAAVVGLPHTARALWPELRRLGIPNLFPRALLDGDELEAEVIGLLPTLDVIGRAAFDHAVACAEGPLAIAVDHGDPASRRLAAAARGRATAHPGVPPPRMYSIAELTKSAARSEPAGGCLLVFADPEQVLALLSASAPRRYVGLLDQFSRVQARALAGRNTFLLADPRVVAGQPLDSVGFAMRVVAVLEQSLRRAGRQLTRSRLVAELTRTLQVTGARPDGAREDRGIQFRVVGAGGAGAMPEQSGVSQK